MWLRLGVNLLSTPPSLSSSFFLNFLAIALAKEPGCLTGLYQSAIILLTKKGVEAWCSGLTCFPVKEETAGSNPVASVLTT